MAKVTEKLDARPLSNPSHDDHVMTALASVVKLIGPWNPKTQLRILSSACIQLGHLDEAESFVAKLRKYV